LKDQYIKVPITLPPYGSCFVAFRKGSPSPTYTNVNPSDANPPLMEFTKDGILFLKEGSYILNGKTGSKVVENKQKTEVLKGEWNVTFTKGWGAPETAVFPELTSWTKNKNEGIRYYSGIGTYHKTFQFEKNGSLPKDEKILLDLGNLSKVAEVWLNGTPLGISWAKPYQYDITLVIRNGENKLVVEVANTWSNRLTGDAITGAKFTKTNVQSTIIPGANIWGSDQTRIPWAKVPLIESGLLGPVTVQTIQLIK
jgi:hypothetical protein